MPPRNQTPAPSVGPVKAEELERIHTNLQKLVGDVAALIDQMKVMELDEVDVWGWKKAERGYKLVFGFCNQLESAMLKEKRRQLYEMEE